MWTTIHRVIHKHQQSSVGAVTMHKLGEDKSESENRQALHNHCQPPPTKRVIDWKVVVLHALICVPCRPWTPPLFPSPVLLSSSPKVSQLFVIRAFATCALCAAVTTVHQRRETQTFASHIDAK